MKATLKILYILSVAFSLKSHAQNIVPNSSFESYISCPFQQGQVNLLSAGWLRYGSSDYFNTCDSSSFAGVPNNFTGQQYAHYGNGYVGLMTYATGVFGREYIEVPLTDSLVSGNTYYVQFYINLADSAMYAVKNIGALFTNTLFDFFPAPSYIWQTGVPQIENVGNVITNKANWIPISGSFIAAGGEKYMSIGNFSNDVNTVKQFVGNGGGSSFSAAYYYVDDVYVSEVPLGVYDEKITDFKLQIYPNPAKDELRIKNEEFRVKNASITIYDVLGNKVVQLKRHDASQGIDVGSISKGVYFIQVYTKDKMYTSKFVKE